MYRYIISRVLLVFPTLAGAAALVFILMRLIPGDICLVRLGSGGTSFTQQALATCHAEIGIDRPWILQFLDFLWGMARLDFGTSMWSGKPVIMEIATRFPISLEVAVMATVIAVALAILLGTLSALKQNSWIDLVVRTFSIAGLATPAFWLGIVSILIVLDVTQAISGHPWMPPIDYVPLWQDPIRNLSIVMLPALTIGYRYAAVSMRLTRSAMLEVLREDYLRTPRGIFAVTWAFLVRQPVGAIGMVLVLIFGLAGIFAEWIAPYSPTANDFSVMTEPPSLAHWLGTDQLGRDLLSRILFGARTAFIVGLTSALVGGLSGLVIGVASAYFGGQLDLWLQRLLDIVMAFPLIIMALAVVSIFGTGIQNVIVAITIPLIPRCARVVRSSALAIREVPYVDAARALGFGHTRIILYHMVPNVMGPFLVIITAFVGQAILADAALSYPGLGVQPPAPAWGLMLQGGAEEYASTAPWIAIFPGLAIMLTVFGINLFGDALRDILDPKLRER